MASSLDKKIWALIKQNPVEDQLFRNTFDEQIKASKALKMTAEDIRVKNPDIRQHSRTTDPKKLDWPASTSEGAETQQGKPGLLALQTSLWQADTSGAQALPQRQSLSTEEVAEVSFAALYSGRLCHFLPTWKEITTNSDALDIVEVVKLPFVSTPVLNINCHLLTFPKKPRYTQVKQSITELLRIGAIEKSTREEGDFLSPYLVRKKSITNIDSF